MALARERQQVADDLRGALGLAQDGVEPAPGLFVDGPLRQPFRPGQDRRERIVQLVGDPGNRLAERRQLLRLQQLMVEVPRLILQPLPFADVAHQRLDAQLARLGARFGVRGHLDPDQRQVGTAQAEQVIGDGSVALQAIDELLARLRIDEAIRPRTAALPSAAASVGEAEHQLEKGIGEQRRVCRANRSRRCRRLRARPRRAAQRSRRQAGQQWAGRRDRWARVGPVVW